jgi:hypothetical protein
MKCRLVVAWLPLETWSLSSWGPEGTHSWSSSCGALLVRESGAQDHRHTSLFLLLSRVLKIIVVRRCEWRRCEQELHTRQKLLVVDPRCHESIRMNFSASPLPGASLSTSGRQIFGVGSKRTQVDEINLMWTHDTWFLDWFGPSRGVIVIHPLLMYYVIEIGSSLFFGIFLGCLRYVPWDFSECPRCGSILSTYS